MISRLLSPNKKTKHWRARKKAERRGEAAGVVAEEGSREAAASTTKIYSGAKQARDHWIRH